MSLLLSGWRQELVRLLANVEAFIDFSESEDIEDGVPEQVNAGVRRLLAELERHLADARAGERLRDGVRVAILGEPNVGKSTFLNTLVQRPAAIVSPIAGTTRDVIETRKVVAVDGSSEGEGGVGKRLTSHCNVSTASFRFRIYVRQDKRPNIF